MTNLEKNPAPTETKSASEDDDGMKKLQKLAGRTAGIGLDLRRTHNNLLITWLKFSSQSSDFNYKPVFLKFHKVRKFATFFLLYLV